MEIIKGLIITAAIAIAIAVPVGYIKNIVDIFYLDFEAPYKAEVLRGAGVLVPPLGVIEGLFVTFDEEEKENVDKP